MTQINGSGLKRSLSVSDLTLESTQKEKVVSLFRDDSNLNVFEKHPKRQWLGKKALGVHPQLLEPSKKNDLSRIDFVKKKGVAPSTDGALLIETLRQGGLPSYAITMQGQLPEVPGSLEVFRDVAVEGGIDLANEFFYSDDVVTVPKRLQKYMSGTSSEALRFEDESIQNYFAGLFEYIKESAKLTSVELTGWDLYHGHLFAYVDPKDPQKRDLGMLFHAKEHPTDLVLGTGQENVKKGSKCSTRDQDFHLRNYLWLMSTNQIVLLDPKHEKFPSGLIAPEQRAYFSVDESAFTSINLGSINYFPGAISGKSGDGKDVLVGASNGFPPDLQIKYASHISDITKIIDGLGSKELVHLLEILKGNAGSKRLERIPIDKRGRIKSLVRVALEKIEGKRKNSISAGLNKLLEKGYHMSNALPALLKTQSGDCTFSVFRAECILQVMAAGYDVNTAAMALSYVDETAQDVEKALEWLSENNW